MSIRTRLRLLAVMAFCMLLLVALSGTACAESGHNWTFDNGILTITGNTSNYQYASSNSPYYTTTPFEAAGILYNVREIVVQEGVTKIGSMSFYDMSNVTSVTLPSTLESIFGEAFMNCSSLSEITIPASVKEIGPYAFLGCNSLTSFTYEGAPPKRGGYSYHYDFYTSATYLPSGSLDVYYYSSNGWTESEITALGSGKTWHDLSIVESGICGESAYWKYDISGYLYIYGTGSVNSYSSGSFTPWNVYNSDITHVVIADGITEIPSYTFEYLSNVVSVRLPDTLESLACNAFNNCSNLCTITIPGSLIYFTDGVFNRCTMLTDIYYMGTEDEWNAIQNNENCRSSDSEFTLHWLTFHKGKEPSCTENGTKDYYSFNGTDNTVFFSLDKEMIDQISIPALGHIETADAKRAVAATCESSGWTQEYHCSRCNTVLIESEEIPPLGHDYVNGICTRQYQIADSGRFDGRMQWALDAHADLTISGNGTVEVFSSWDQTPWSAYHSAITSLYLNEGVTALLGGPFEGMEKLQSVSLPASLESFSCSAFRDCTQLEEITVPGHLTQFVDGPFTGCYALRDIYFVGTEEEWQTIQSTENCRSVDSSAEIHFALFHQGKRETCTEDGLEDHYAFDGTVNPSMYSVDKHRIEQAVIPARGHTRVPGPSTAVSATCEFPGHTQGYYCQSCWTVLEEPVEIPALGHEYVDGICTRYKILDSGSCGSNAYWNYDSHGVLTISGSGAIDSYQSGKFTPWATYNKTIREIIVEDGITDIPTYAFEYIENLELVSLPNTLNTFACNAFNDCYRLREITIPGSIRSFVQMRNFNRCFALSDIYYIGTEEEWETIENNTSCISNDSQAEIHFAIYEKEKPATCTEIGNEAYYLLDRNGNTDIFSSDKEIIDDIPILNALSHDWSEISYVWAEDNKTVTATRICTRDTRHAETETVAVTSEVAKAATCETMGETTYTSAAFKNVAFAVQTKTETDIPALGHRWGETSYIWADDSSMVTATRICECDASHVETETVSVTSKVENAATCEAMGDTTYTSAVFQNAAFAVQTKTETDIPLLGHEWCEPSYIWADDYSTVTATRVCLHDSSHEETETVGVTSEITMVPSCESKGKTTYTSADFENGAFEIQTKRISNIDAIGHDWGNPVYTWAGDKSTVTATRTCNHDNSHVETETVSVTFEITKQATCDTKGIIKYTSAEFENEEFAVQVRSLPDVPATGHDWGKPVYAWANDNSTVTATRVCGNNDEHVETETVDVVAEVTIPATCEEMGVTTYTGNQFHNTAFAVQVKEVEDIDALGHSPVIDVAVEATCTATGLTEGSHCSKCGKVLTEQETIPATKHQYVIFDAVPATCEEEGLTSHVECVLCGHILIASSTISALGHDWSEPGYIWSDDNSTVTATRGCTRDASHVETETVATTSKVAKAATCEAMGDTIYTSATFKNTAFAVQTETETDIPALGHSWGEPSYVWSDDNSKVTATRTCTHDASHTETETVTTERRLTESPTKTEKGEFTYQSAEFLNSAFSAQMKSSANLPALSTLNGLVLPTAVQHVEEEAFMNGTFEYVIVPEACTSIGSRAFADCVNLIYIKIPASVKTVAEDAFVGCANTLTIDRLS